MASVIGGPPRRKDEISDASKKLEETRLIMRGCGFFLADSGAGPGI
jgi:hypothetical protein